jgi:hypothetical protein
VQPLALIRWLLIIGGLCYSLAPGQDAGQRIPRQRTATNGAVEGLFLNDQRLGLGNVAVTLRNLADNQAVLVRTTGDGIFRVVNVRPGRYSIRAVLDGYRTFDRSNLVVRPGELVSVQVELLATGVPVRKRIPELNPGPSYRKFPSAPEEDGPLPPELTPPTYSSVPNRWKFDWPDYHRYGPKDEEPYVQQHIYDPFNRNTLKGDYPIFGNETFLNVNLVSDAVAEARRSALGNGVISTKDAPFFGRAGQLAMTQNLIFSVTLSHGDAAFKPVDWQIRITPQLNINYLDVGPNDIVNNIIRTQTSRLDTQAALQEAFFEYKIKDLSHNYDFVSVRAGIQTFNSDFRGFIFFDQEPGARFFGNLKSNRYQYNAAYFAMLEKDANSGLNTFNYRHQQVFIANLFRQDFIKPGYTTEVSYHFNKDDPSSQVDVDGFLARPAPAGSLPHAIRAHYIGWTGDGHFGRLNIDHAFYQVLGHDTSNPIAALLVSNRTAYQSINAQMAAVELSEDRDWLRLRTSVFYSSGDKNPRDGTAHGFDAIFDNSNFAGGFFSYWSRESVRLPGVGLNLVQPGSLIPSMRSSKAEGQSNFVNPGIFIVNAAADADLTPKLRVVGNFNVIRFIHPEPLDLLLSKTNIHSGVGADSGVGLTYRPYLSENILFTGVFNAFVPFQGFRDIYTGSTLFAVALNVRFRF